MEATTVKTTRTDLLNIDPRSIRIVNGFNPREDYGDIEGLALSITENGVKNPLSGYKKIEDGVEVYYLTDGHRRLKATMIAIANGAEIMRVPFRLESKTYTTVDRICDTVIKNDGKALTQYELAKVFNKLVEEYGWSTSEVGKKFGKQQSYVCNTINLLTLPEAIREYISKGSISITAAMSIVRNVEDETDAINAVEEAIQKANKRGKTKATDKDVTSISVNSNKRLNDAKKGLKAMLDLMSEDEEITTSYDELFNTLTSIYTSIRNGSDIKEALNSVE
ncbi:MAG: ParB/RepB/Spo0J family partition protein [Sarcina sp.]